LAESEPNAGAGACRRDYKVKGSMKSEMNDEETSEEGLELHDSRQLHGNFTLVQSIAHINFSNLVNTNSCGFAPSLAECDASYGLCDVSRISNLAHTKDGS
jgi:hypothetical protein